MAKFLLILNISSAIGILAAEMLLLFTTLIISCINVYALIYLYSIVELPSISFEQRVYNILVSFNEILVYNSKFCNSYMNYEHNSRNTCMHVKFQEKVAK